MAKVISFFKRNGLKMLWVIYVTISMIVVLRTADGLLTQDYESASKCFFLNDGWDITFHDTTSHDVSLEKFTFDKAMKGDTVVMESVLPGEWDVTEGVLRLNGRHFSVKMFIDDDLVYEYGSDRIEKNKTLGSGYLFIDFPDEYKGKNLRLELQAGENNKFTKIDQLRVYEWKNAYRVLLTDNRIPMLAGIFLVIFGFSTLIITLVAMLVSIGYIQIFWISLFSICTGLWTLCNYNVLLVFSMPLYSKSLVEYMSLYFLPIPILLYMYESVKNLNNRVMKMIFWILFAVQVAFDVVIIGLHTNDIVHYAAMLKYFQMLSVCHVIYLVVVAVKNLKTNTYSFLNRLYLVGMLIVLGCIGYDLYSYYLDQYSGGSASRLKGMFALGMLVFTFILIIEFYMKISYKMMEEAERNSLIRSAYTDELTQLHNRRFCSEHMQRINEEQDAEYTVVCFDLNNLKVVNDTLGHAQGDILIKSAAQVIEKTFGRYGVVGRMGGDEFIAILKNSRKEGMDVFVEQFRENIDKKNKEVPGLNLAIAYGYASSDETGEKGIEKLYQQADDRMYVNKQQYKKEHPDARGRQ